MSSPNPMITAEDTPRHTLASRDAARYVFNYLTPHKVFLLILLHAYCTASVPTKYHAVVFTLLLHHIEVNVIRIVLTKYGPIEQYSPLDYLQERFSALPSTLTNKSIYDVLLEMVFKYHHTQ
jgi:hypothetical protein